MSSTTQRITNHLQKAQKAIPIEKITSQLTRTNLDKIWSLVMMGNSVFAVVSVIIFFLSSWWIFLILGIIGFPFIAVVFLLCKYTNLKASIERWAKRYVVKMYESIVQSRTGLFKRVYTLITWFIPRNEWKHINWGYAKLSKDGNLIGELENFDEEKRYYLQLYNYLATGFGSWNLEGKNILEVKCGGGGGIDYLTRYLNPALCIGVDDESTAETKAIRDSFKDNTKLRFYSAESLDNLTDVPQIADERIDIAISVQSSTHFTDFSKLVKEIDSLVRPGGFFAFTDLRLAQDWAQLERELQSSPMTILKKENISNNVMLALKLDEVSKWKIISSRFGSWVRRLVKRIGIIKDNALAESLAHGNNVAMAYILHKVPQAGAH